MSQRRATSHTTPRHLRPTDRGQVGGTAPAGGRAAITAAVVLLLLAACGADEGSDAASPPTSSPSADEAWVACRNPEVGYRVEHPPEWRSNPATVMAPCSLFDPGPIAVRPATEVPAEIAVAIRREPVAFERLTAAGSPGEVVLDRREDVVAGRLAVRLEVQATGQGLQPDGTRSTRWVIRLEGSSLVARTTDVGSPPYDRKQHVLDRMVRGLELPEPGLTS